LGWLLKFRAWVFRVWGFSPHKPFHCVWGGKKAKEILKTNKRGKEHSQWFRESNSTFRDY